MSKEWKKVLVAVCVASMLMTMPGMCVLAYEMQEVELAVEGTEDLEETEESVDFINKGVTVGIETPIKEESVSQDETDEVVGAGEINVGDGVTATLNADTGVVELTSKNGELWREWLDKLGVERNRIKSIRIVSGTVYLPADSSDMFASCSGLESLNLSGFDTSNVTNMGGMFSCCENLGSLDVSDFDTSNVTDMSDMFSGCKSLTSLDVSSFDTSNVTRITGMFNNCKSLKSLDVSGFDTGNVMDMGLFFNGCESLTGIDVSNFDTSNVMDMVQFFSGCKSLTSLDVSGFDTAYVKNMAGFFSGCENLTNLDVSGFTAGYVESMSSMFEGCKSLTSLNVSKMSSESVMDISHMFEGCMSLTSLNLGFFTTSNVIDMSEMFKGCKSLESLNLRYFDTSNVWNMGGMFSGCESLENLDLSRFDTSNVSDIYYMLNGCSNLQTLKTPIIFSEDIGIVTLPTTMYDESGKAYTKLPVRPQSITLTRSKPDAHIINDFEFILSETNYVYDGKTKEPSVTVKNGTIALSCDTDYTVKYSNNTDAGIAKVTITGKGSYTGSVSKTFMISKADPMLSFAQNSVFRKITDAAFTNPLTKVTTAAVRYVSGDASIATVDSKSGIVAIKGAGTVTITAFSEETTNYNEGITSYTLTVERPAPASTPASGFSDVQDLSHPYYNAIYWAAEAGITKGYADGTFGVNKSCTRGEMIMFLWRFVGKPAPKSVAKSPFKDVPTNHTFYKAVLWAYQTGVTKGYSDGTFGINRNVSRGECMMFLWRVKGKATPKPVSKSPFKDVPKTHAFYKAILWGSQKGITKGYTSGPKKGNFGIDDNCTRGQIVTFLYRAK